MQKLFLVLCAIICVVSASAQNNLNIIIKNQESQRPIKNVNIEVKGKDILSTTDENGIALIKNIPNGGQSLIISCIGFQTSTVSIILPYSATSLFQVELTPSEDELDEVIISSTRTSRTIRNTPTRVETIELEEIDEKSNMRPANVSMILHESTGIAVQQTSATSGNASIRIQGLDGRYTQLLKDGYASFGNFASGLSVLEIPPLDLAQVEIIKGPSSTLYGAGAIAGVVNFISRTPKEKADYNFIVNQSNVGQTNIGGFTMNRNKKFGYSLLALVNFQKPYDVDNDDFTELPKSKDFTIHPKIFIYPNERTSIIFGNSFTTSDKTGGDIYLIMDGPTSNHTYFENNNTSRNTTTFDLSIKPNKKDLFRVKSSFNYFKRKIGTPGYLFNGSNYNFYNDVSYLKNLENQSLIFGGNLIYDNFKERDASNAKDFKTKTAGLYVQQTLDISEKLKLENGIRADITQYGNNLYNKTDFFLLPRVSALYNFTEKWSSRIGGGLGYKTPTLFTEQTETFQYQNLNSLSNVESEKSYGGTADVNFKTSIGEDWLISLNQMFFYTRINNSTILLQNASQNFYFSNTTEAVDSKGFETNAKLIFKDNFKLFAGYTYTNAKANYLPIIQEIRLLPKNRLNLALLYEKEKNIKLGLEGYFTDRQYLYNNFQTPSYWEFGFMAEKYFGKISFFINAENFTDTRQSRYKSVVNGSHTNPTFDDIWTHTEGRTFNAGIKLRL